MVVGFFPLVGGTMLCMTLGALTFHKECFGCKECSKGFGSGPKEGAYGVHDDFYCYACAKEKSKKPTDHANSDL